MSLPRPILAESCLGAGPMAFPGRSGAPLTVDTVFPRADVLVSPLESKSSSVGSHHDALSLDELFALATTPRPSRDVTPVTTSTPLPASAPSSTPTNDPEIRRLLSELRLQDEKLEQAGRLGIELHAQKEALERKYRRLQDEHRDLLDSVEASASTVDLAGGPEVAGGTAETLSLETLLQRSRSTNKALVQRNRSLNKHCEDADARIEDLDAQMRSLSLRLRQSEQRCDLALKECEDQRQSLEESARQRALEQDVSARTRLLSVRAP